ncbi:GGDEF domain-containing protein [Marinobacter lutaoensis]|uniref:GGDEF domain-containing protein n=1 Tax=Marinobacter lutaoensis TaxID=135739 RepID=UPI000C0A1992|nr:GGDEF domain-containing protein [Marinobacter lutaoensis]MBE02469.1 hypothetical protein [Marinobacter sp.]MBI43887.1 hypothetical protein [Oceanospirillales bacterium]NVD35958.1 GGDEF domain-containing protein [Marinobacter lutaoensis]|tara:strand:+ start:191 stop:667 length:477 start_codon:yes stop_codon:yes gene_type:complete
MLATLLAYQFSHALRGVPVADASGLDLLLRATTDQLTGLLNRHAFLPLIRQEIHQAERNGQHRFSVILGDLDHFKRVNDRFGHETGDRVLQETATRIRACLRRGDALCRWGGEELLILLPGTGVRGPGRWGARFSRHWRHRRAVMPAERLRPGRTDGL